MRGKDLDKGKYDIPWEAREPVYTFEDGWTIEKVQTPADLALEGELMYHCARDHAFWVNKGVEVFFSLRTDIGVPKATIYCKPVEFFKVEQPEDKEHFDSYGYKFGNEIDGLPAVYKSTHYETYYKDILFTFTFEDRELYLNHMSGSGKEEYVARVKEWLATLGANGAGFDHWNGGYGIGEDYDDGYDDEIPY